MVIPGDKTSISSLPDTTHCTYTTVYTHVAIWSPYSKDAQNKRYLYCACFPLVFRVFSACFEKTSAKQALSLLREFSAYFPRVLRKQAQNKRCLYFACFPLVFRVFSACFEKTSAKQALSLLREFSACFPRVLRKQAQNKRYLYCACFTCVLRVIF